MPDTAPLSVEVTRGPIVESRHLVHVVAVDADGRIIRQWGHAEEAVYPRSANKMIQALPLIESGAADAYGLEPRELALACASHSGEPKHVSTVTAWLERIGLDHTALECGSHWPSNEEATRGMAARGEIPSALHNNCSGKHTSMLSHARHLKEDTKGYIGIEHGVQRRVAAAIGEVTGIDMKNVPVGIDGCAIPTFAIPLKAFAHGLARMASGKGLSTDRATAAKRLLSAMGAHPDMVAGTGRFDTTFMGAVKGRIATKGGAEGVWAAALPDHGIGIALKTVDGIGRSGEIALIEALKTLDLLRPEEVDAVAAIARPAIRNRNGMVVGEIRPGAPAF